MNSDVIFGLAIVLTVITFDTVCAYYRYRSGFDCDKCKDWTCPYHGCMKRKKNKQP